jgi:hypothetical protein
MSERIGRWWFSPVPLSRIERLRSIIYGFLLFDVLLLRPWVSDRGMLPADLYHPLFIGRLLPFPTPTAAIVGTVKYVLVLSALAVVFRRSPRLLGSLVFVLYLQWMLFAFSYGKVDHDRVAFLVALAVLPTVPPSTSAHDSPSEAAGWALRCIQVGVVLTYFLAVMAKLRYGGVDWVNGATLTRAVLRRGSPLAAPLSSRPWILHVTQYLIVLFELASPLLLVKGRVGRAYLLLAVTFHIVTFAMIEILFWPHVVCLSAFLALERFKLRERSVSKAHDRAMSEDSLQDQSSEGKHLVSPVDLPHRRP